MFLDIKPSNIWLFPKNGLSRRVALFDFDTVLPTDENGYLLKPYPEQLPFSESWSPYEQSHQQFSVVSRATDVYAFGAIIYWLYTGNTVDSLALEKMRKKDFTFLDENKYFEGAQNAKGNVIDLLQQTLIRGTKHRAQNMEDLL
ncbi:hypothetical protein FACS1894167_10600 [Synergistales bacterium]|nr:hypothetical protein FACS1894167_10600 [Synergistales bacterium]